MKDTKEVEDVVKKEEFDNSYNPNKPNIVTIPFLESNKLIHRITSKVGIKRPIAIKLKEPILFLIKNDGYTHIIENIKPGEFYIMSKKGTKTIMIRPKKISTLLYGKQMIKCYFAHEDCCDCLPENPMFTAEMYEKTVFKLSMNYKDRDEVRRMEARGKMWLAILLGVGVFATILFSNDGFRNMFIGNPVVEETVKTVLDEAKKNITQIADNVVSVS